jgi:hypothetical protein
MHNVSGRFSSAFFFGVTVLAALSAINSLSTFFIEYEGKAEVSNIKLVSFRPNKAFGWDEADF